MNDTIVPIILTDKSDGEKILINASCIFCCRRVENFTSVEFLHKENSDRVVETPEEIFAKIAKSKDSQIKVAPLQIDGKIVGNFSDPFHVYLSQC